MSLLMREVPSLAPAPSSEPVVQPVPGGLPAGVLPGVPPGVLPQAPHHQPLFPPMQRQGVATGAASQLPSSSLPLFGGSSYSHHPPADPALQQLDLLQRQLDELRHGRQLPQESFLWQQDHRSLQDHHLSQVQSGPSNSNVNFLFDATIRNKQFRAIDFAKLGSFPYASQLKPNNFNLALFSFGSFKHLLSLLDGTLAPVSHTELCSRLQHLVNVMDIVCLASDPSQFDNPAWKIGNFYNEKIVRDVELGFKHWETLDRCIDPAGWAYAKEILAKTNQKSNQSNNKSQGNQNQNSSAKMCTTYNHFRGEGCQYKFNNPRQQCVFQHICGSCKAKGLVRKHKSWQCNASQNTLPNPSFSTAPPQLPTVTSA